MEQTDPIKVNAQQLRESIAMLTQNGELLEQSHKQISQVLFARFQCLVAAGFSESQALEIVKFRGLLP